MDRHSPRNRASEELSVGDRLPLITFLFWVFPWCVAALLRLILEPRDLSDASFHLTYAGAGALLFIGKHLIERRWLAMIVGAELAITPLTLFHFHQYAIGGALLTFAMAPVIFAMLIVSLLAAAFPIAF